MFYATRYSFDMLITYQLSCVSLTACLRACFRTSSTREAASLPPDEIATSGSSHPQTPSHRSSSVVSPESIARPAPGWLWGLHGLYISVSGNGVVVSDGVVTEKSNNGGK